MENKIKCWSKTIEAACEMKRTAVQKQNLTLLKLNRVNLQDNIIRHQNLAKQWKLNERGVEGRGTQPDWTKESYPENKIRRDRKQKTVQINTKSSKAWNKRR